jgi:hypothetical protein
MEAIGGGIIRVASLLADLIFNPRIGRLPKERQPTGSDSGEFRLVGGLSWRLFIASVGIALGKELYPCQRRHLKLKLLFPSSSRNL